MQKIPLPTTLRIIVIIVWIVLFGALLKRDYFINSLELTETRIIEKAREESFMGIYFHEERIGYVKNKIAPKQDGDGFKLEQEAFMRLNILDQNHPIRMDVAADLDAKQQMENFIFHLSSPFYEMEAHGRVDGTTVNFTLSTGKETIEDRIKLSRPPFLSTSRRAYLLKEGLQPGDKVKIPYFDPISLAGKDTIIEYKGEDKQLINDRVFKLHHFVEDFSGMKISSWLDDEGKVIKEQSPAGFVFISEPEFKATDIASKGREILASVSVPVQGEIPVLTSLKKIRYKLTLPPDTEFDLDKDRQKLTGNILTVRLENPPPAFALACTDQTAELAPSPYIQTGNPLIGSTSADIVQGLDKDVDRIKALAAWVYKNLEKRPVLGIPDAVTTLKTLKGDCNEHAALFAALARNAQIPTRIVAGVTLMNNAFYYHAWNEVCLDSGWLTVDTTRNQIPADITHIKFVEGETAEQVRIGALLGRLQIEIVAE